MAQDIIFFASDLDISVFMCAKPFQMYFLLKLEIVHFVFIPRCSEYQSGFSVILNFHFCFLQTGILCSLSVAEGVYLGILLRTRVTGNMSTLGINILFYFV